MLDVVIVGGGIAGQTAAIYAARKRMDYAFIVESPGGQFLESGEVLNYPGVVKTTGVEFQAIMEEQLRFNDVKVNAFEKATRIQPLDGGFRVETDKSSYETRSVIIATGARPRKLSVPGESELKNKGVTYCSICDGPIFSGMDVAIVGGGNSALEAVEFMSRIARKMYLLNIKDKFTAHEYLSEKISSYKNLEVIMPAKTKKILGKDRVEGLVYERGGVEHELIVSGVIVEIGRTPNVDFVRGFLELDDQDYIAIDCQTHTSVAGVFAAGDCASGREYQYIIAAGQGCMALLKAARYLANNG